MTAKLTTTIIHIHERLSMNSNLNVDPSEIAKFEALAKRWWDKNSEFKPLHDINPLRSNFIDAR